MADDEARAGQRPDPGQGLHRRQAVGPSADYRELERRAAHELRVAWLRVHGHRMFAVDPTGLTSAQLWDFAELLEVLEAEGRWTS